jgi:Fe-S cluster biosynthesis and repair protein YggX
MCAEMSNQERLAVFQNMVAADPQNELAHFSLGRLYFELHDLANSERSLRRTLELNPKHSVAHRLLGQLLSETGRRDEAVEVLQRGVLLAHQKGEFQPRNQMQEILRSLGVAPPDPAKEERGKRGIPEGQFVCQRCGQPNSPLEEQPFENALGAQILERICQNCWREWIAMSTKVINEYRLNLATAQGSQVYDFHMKEFLGLEEPGPEQAGSG